MLFHGSEANEDIRHTEGEALWVKRKPNLMRCQKKLQGRSSGLGSKETPKTCDEAKEEVLDWFGVLQRHHTTLDAGLYESNKWSEKFVGSPDKKSLPNIHGHGMR